MDILTSWPVDKLTRGPGRQRNRGSAKVQIGAELLCKSAKVNLGVAAGIGRADRLGQPRLSEALNPTLCSETG